MERKATWHRKNTTYLSFKQSTTNHVQAKSATPICTTLNKLILICYFILKQPQHMGTQLSFSIFVSLLITTFKKKSQQYQPRVIDLVYVAFPSQLKKPTATFTIAVCSHRYFEFPVSLSPWGTWKIIFFLHDIGIVVVVIDLASRD